MRIERKTILDSEQRGVDMKDELKSIAMLTSVVSRIILTDNLRTDNF